MDQDDTKPENTNESFTCSRCGKSECTDVTRATWKTPSFSIISCLLCGLPALLLIPIYYLLFQKVERKCTHCGETVRRKARISFALSSKEVVTAKFGHCAVVISLKYVLVLSIFLIGIASISALRWSFNHWSLPDPDLTAEKIDASWEEFNSDCGPRSYLGNPIRAQELFEKKYTGRMVRWTGKLLFISESYFSKHMMYLQIYPRLSDRRQPDLALLFGSRLKQQVVDLSPGEFIELDAVLYIQGKRGLAHLGTLVGFNKTEWFEPPILSPFGGMFNLLEFSKRLMNNNVHSRGPVVIEIGNMEDNEEKVEPESVKLQEEEQHEVHLEVNERAAVRPSENLEVITSI